MAGEEEIDVRNYHVNVKANQKKDYSFSKDKADNTHHADGGCFKTEKV